MRKLIGIILLLAINPLSHAQSFILKQWTWNDYSMEFEAPNNMSIEESDGNAFKCKNDNIALSIYPRTGENLSYDNMKNQLINWAQQNNITYDAVKSDGTKEPFYMSDLNGFWGVAIDGYHNDGNPTTVCLLVNPHNTNISFYIWVSYQSNYLDDAVAILRSFRPL